MRSAKLAAALRMVAEALDDGELVAAPSANDPPPRNVMAPSQNVTPESRNVTPASHAVTASHTASPQTSKRCTCAPPRRLRREDAGGVQERL